MQDQAGRSLPSWMGGETVAVDETILSRSGVPTFSYPDTAARAAADLGFPVVLKLHSETITHKAEVGGVRLNLRSTLEVKTAFRAIRRSVSEKAGDSQFAGVIVQPMCAGGYELIPKMSR